MSDRLETFWAELVKLVGPDFSGNLVLHCTQGTIVKYEVHQVRRPRGGAVEMDEALDASPTTVLRSSRP